MSTSGTYTFTMTRDDIIKAALRQVGAYETGQPVAPELVTDTAQALNIMCKAMQTSLGGLWAIVDTTLFLNTTSQSYLIGPTGSSATVDVVNQDNLAVAAANGAGSITVASIAGFAQGQYIGLQMDDGSTLWTKITGIAGAVISLNANLYTTSAAGNNVFSYTDVAQRPLDILEAKRRDVNGNDTTIIVGNRDDYEMLSNKMNQGSVSQVYYQPTLNNGTLYVWPVSVNSTDRIVMSAKIPFQDFDSMTDNAYFPVEALRMLKWNLAEEIMIEWDCNPQKCAMISKAAEKAKAEFSFYDTEVSFNFAPEYRR